MNKIKDCVGLSILNGAFVRIFNWKRKAKTSKRRTLHRSTNMTRITFWLLLAFICMTAAQIVSGGESNEQYVSIYNNSIKKHYSKLEFPRWNTESNWISLQENKRSPVLNVSIRWLQKMLCKNDLRWSTLTFSQTKRKKIFLRVKLLLLEWTNGTYAMCIMHNGHTFNAIISSWCMIVVFVIYSTIQMVHITINSHLTSNQSPNNMGTAN